MKKGVQPSGLLTRKKVLSASINIFLEKGYEKATAKELAELADISTGSPFAIFGNKEGVLLELVHMMFSRQFGQVEDMIGTEADPLLLYGVETALQIHIAELSEPLRELYVTAYSLSSTSEYIYEQTTERLQTIFSAYLPQAEAKDFYEFDLASGGIMRSVMAMHGFVNGLPDGRFAPQDSAARAESSAVLQRVILARASAAVLSRAVRRMEQSHTLERFTNPAGCV